MPRGFEISTPVGKYNPDWAIAFKKGTVKHIYFVAETKGQLQSLNFGTMTNTNPIEQTKIDCAKKHFKAIGGENVKYGVVKGFKELLDIVAE